MAKIPAWLEDCVFYQIYPQSFFDSNGDGIGDLPGIEAKLEYIRSLGCTAIWMNPCFESPFRDAGYDVADYYKVAPRYGTNSDLRRLFAAARRRNIRICLDLVPGRTSIEHPWFKESCHAARNRYSSRYIWTNSVWESVPDMKTVDGYGERYGNYVTNFFWSQPALNYGFGRPDPDCPWQLPYDHPDCRATREELRRIMRYWLDMGASGFRVDMAFSLVKKDVDAKCTRKLWGEVRTMLDKEYPEAVIISEWGCPAEAIRAGFHVDFMFHFGPPGYTSLFRSETPFFSREGGGDITVFLDEYHSHLASTRANGHIAIPSSNHDMSRLGCKRTARELKVAFAFLLTMPGVPFIYYGDEIGMRDVDGLPSKEGGYNRTGARTPMQWTHGHNAGFSGAPSTKLYLPVDTRKVRPDVATQEGSDSSLLNTVRKFVALRRENPALRAGGAFEAVYAKKRKYPFAYLRSLGDERILVAVNPCREPAIVSLALPGASNSVETLHTMGAGLEMRGAKASLRMDGVSCGVWRL